MRFIWKYIKFSGFNISHSTTLVKSHSSCLIERMNRRASFFSAVVTEYVGCKIDRVDIN